MTRMTRAKQISIAEKLDRTGWRDDEVPTYKEILHRAHNRSANRGSTVMPTTSDVEFDPACQEMIQRLGQNISDVNSVDIDVKQHILGVASVVRAARARA